MAARKPADREARLIELVKRYAEGDRRLLEVLQRPDLDQLIESVAMPDEIKALFTT